MSSRPRDGARAPAALETLALDRERIPTLVLEVLRTLQGAGKQAFLAGGAVRDLARLALGQAAAPAAGERWPADFDIATDALPEEVIKIFPRTVPTGLQHGTVTVLARGKGEEHKVEVTTFRGEGPYLDGRRPSAVSFLGDIEGDLARRDFTVNAMAWDPLAPGLSGLRDPFGGLADLHRHLLRAVGEARDRFAEDGLRPLRAIRFAATLRLALEPRTARAIGETLETFAKVARERVRDELEKLLLRGRPVSRGARLLLRTGLLRVVAPELAASAARDRAGWRRSLRALDAAPALLEVRLALLLLPLAAGPAAALCDSLRIPSRQRDRVLLLLREQPCQYTAAWSDGECRRLLARLTPAELPAFIALRNALAAADGAPARDRDFAARLEQLLASGPPLTTQALALDGRALMAALPLAPGPALGRILRGLLEAVLDDPSLNNFAALLRLASELLKKEPTGNPQR